MNIFAKRILSKKLLFVLPILLLLLGLGFRVLGAWHASFSLDPDEGIAALMSKHSA
ncbi:MAG: hypothetical protein GX811_04830 [Lentisphaerae bacterium]|nr:hypothetical protein [Lentisphaerota bacterium]